MEEDIETLEDLKNIFIHLKNYGWVNDIKKDIVADKVIKAIENLIARNKELEVKLKLSKELYDDACKCLLGTIEKSKAEELLEKLDKEEKQELKGVKGQDRYFIKQIYQAKKNAIQELLQGK